MSLRNLGLLLSTSRLGSPAGARTGSNLVKVQRGSIIDPYDETESQIMGQPNRPAQGRIDGGRVALAMDGL